MFPMCFTMFARAVKEGLILWTDYYGYIEVWTQFKYGGDLIYQFGCDVPVSTNPYEFIMEKYYDGNLIWQGVDENV